MPGFIGVNYGELKPVEADADIEVYLIYETHFLYRGKAPGVIEKIDSSLASFNHGWSYDNPLTFNAYNFDGVFHSSDGGKTFGTVQAVPHAPSVERRLDFLYSRDEGIWRSVTGGVTWTEIVAAPASDADYNYIFQNFGLSTTNIYIDVSAEAIDTAPTKLNEVRMALLDGGAASRLCDGRIVGQVGNGMIVVDYTDQPTVFTPVPVKRDQAGSLETVTGIPDEFAADSTSGEENERPFHTYTGVALFGTTAILTAQSHIDGVAPTVGHIYRSTNSGHAFTEVKTWDLLGTTGKFGRIEIGYAGQKEGVWWVGGANDGSTPGLWRSEDDGVTWAFVTTPDSDDGFIILDNTPKISSAKRTEDYTR